MTRISIICAAVGALAALTLSVQSASAGSVNIPTNTPKVTVRPPPPPKLNNAIVIQGSHKTPNNPNAIVIQGSHQSGCVGECALGGRHYASKAATPNAVTVPDLK